MTGRRYTLGNAHNCARNHAICDGPQVVARVTGAGYPAGTGWAPETEAIARELAAAPQMADALHALLNAILSGPVLERDCVFRDGVRALHAAGRLSAAAVARAEAMAGGTT